ncbi:SMC-Scp complex subunit ScpB [Paractinoplanes lichenicola]|uniref:SMC-Scp complex subunit ScpB n=1 Tax=Paractinoplanes lichenicola TaxID=2802976 RepID=UPI003F6910C6
MSADGDGSAEKVDKTAVSAGGSATELDVAAAGADVTETGPDVTADGAGKPAGKARARKSRAGDAGKDSAAPAASGGKPAAVPGQKRRAGEPLGTGDEPTTRTEDEFDLPGLTEDAELAGALEAIMLVVDEPVAELQLAQILEQPTERIAAMLDNLSARYTAAGHGFDLRRVAGGWRLYTRPEYAAYVERFVLDGQSVRLTQAALETLAVVAYKQPVTRSRISAIRGVNCDGVMRTLATRGLIEECGTESETGAHLYRTTGLFLEKLGLNSVDQLPPLAPFLPDDVEEVLDATG